MRKKALLTSMLWLGAACLAYGPRSHAATTGDALVAFGDSFSDTGLVWQALMSARGENLPYSPPYHEGRFANGPVAVEHMAEQLGLALDSRAWGGAMSGEGNILGTRAGLGESGMASQVRRHVAEQQGHQLDEDTLYFIWVGANDLILRPTDAAAARASANIVQAIDALYAAGARTFFVPLMPDLSLSPLLASDPAEGDNLYRLASLSFNASLTADLASARQRLADAHIVHFDTMGYMQAWRQSPRAEGMDATQACVDGTFARVVSVCAEPDRHVYWDGTHYSARVHAELGSAFASAVPEPAGLALMGWGLFGLSWLVNRLGRVAQGSRPLGQLDADAGAAPTR